MYVCMLYVMICWGMVVTYYRNKFVNVSLPKRLSNGRFISETATWVQKWFKISAVSAK